MVFVLQWKGKHEKSSNYKNEWEYLLWCNGTRGISGVLGNSFNLQPGTVQVRNPALPQLQQAQVVTSAQIWFLAQKLHMPRGRKKKKIHKFQKRNSEWKGVTAVSQMTKSLH